LFFKIKIVHYYFLKQMHFLKGGIVMKNFVQKSAHAFQTLNPKFKNVIEQVLRVVKKTFIKVLLLLDKLIMYLYIRIIFLLIVVYIVADKLIELIKEVKSKK